MTLRCTDYMIENTPSECGGNSDTSGPGNSDGGGDRVRPPRFKPNPPGHKSKKNKQGGRVLDCMDIVLLLSLPPKAEIETAKRRRDEEMRRREEDS